jgi:nitroreductase
MFAAADLGIATARSSVGDQEKARAILDVPGGYEVAYLLGVGYPADIREYL